MTELTGSVAVFNPTPSIDRTSRVHVDRRALGAPADADVVGYPVGVSAVPCPTPLGLDRATLAAAGFEGKVGQTLVVPRTRRARRSSPSASVTRRSSTPAVLRDAAAAFGRATGKHGAPGDDAGRPRPPSPPRRPGRRSSRALLLARYRYGALKKEGAGERPGRADAGRRGPGGRRPSPPAPSGDGSSPARPSSPATSPTRRPATSRRAGWPTWRRRSARPTASASRCSTRPRWPSSAAAGCSGSTPAARSRPA